MKVNKIFRWVWRLNAVMIFAGGIIVLVVIISAFYPTIKDFLSRKPVYHESDMVNVDERADIGSEWRLGGFNRISTTSFLISPFFSKQEYNVGFGSGKDASATRNYLILDSSDKSTRWLVPTNNNLFLNQSEIHETADKNSKVVALRYNVVQEDTNGDGRLTDADKTDFAISDINGANFSTVVRWIDDFLGEEQPSADTLFLFYRSDGKNLFAEIGISEKKIIETKELPKINE
ncbi:hypothetical protein BH18ACI3_BH18ACI3_13960 [soil metagenome]